MQDKTNRRKQVYRVGIIGLLVLVIVLMFVACGQKKQNASNQNQLPSGAISAVGKTYNQLKTKYPNYVANSEMIAYFTDAEFPYLGLPNAQYGFVFFGTQEAPFLADVGKIYGDQIKCIGVTGTVGNLFPKMNTDLSFKGFFSFLGVKNYTFDSNKATDSPTPGELDFKYKGFDVIIAADGSQKTKIIKKSYQILITKGDVTINDQYYNRVHDKFYSNQE